MKVRCRRHRDRSTEGADAICYFYSFTAIFSYYEIVANASVTDTEIASAGSVGMVVAHTGLSNHRVLNLVI